MNEAIPGRVVYRLPCNPVSPPFSYPQHPACHVAEVGNAALDASPESAIAAPTAPPRPLIDLGQTALRETLLRGLAPSHPPRALDVLACCPVMDLVVAGEGSNRSPGRATSDEPLRRLAEILAELVGEMRAADDRPPRSLGPRHLPAAPRQHRHWRGGGPRRHPAGGDRFGGVVGDKLPAIPASRW